MLTRLFDVKVMHAEQFGLEQQSSEEYVSGINKCPQDGLLIKVRSWKDCACNARMHA